MGAIRGAIKDTDAVKDQSKFINELLNSLGSLAQTKANLFVMEIENSLRSSGTDQNQRVPIESILTHSVETHAYAKQGVDEIIKTVSGALKDFCSGSTEKIVGGVGRLFGDALGHFLGQSSGGEREIGTYAIMTEGMSIIRVDMRAWYRDTTAIGFTNELTSVSAVAAVKSAVDLSKIGFSTFLNVYQEQLKPHLNGNDVAEEMENARKIYEEYHRRVQPNELSTDATRGTNVESRPAPLIRGRQGNSLITDRPGEIHISPMWEP